MLKKPSAEHASPITEYLQILYDRHKKNGDGAVADYIPELAKANPNWFGICLVTADGRVYEVGDSQQTFTIQSISKPFVYGMALEDMGRSDVLAKVGVEPTGDAFNSISLHPETGRPANPMINAGAIATTGLVQGRAVKDKFRRILDTFGAYVGRDLELDETVYKSESDTGHRNRAISHLLRNFDILEGDPEPALDLYFRQCSILVNCRDLAVMGATLAAGGINPITGKQAVRSGYIENILAVMGSCGMYDYAGEWIYRVGMPAKSGVAGGIVAVLPGRLGIGVFSPPLDERGNSVRGIRVFDDISRDYDLHLFNVPRFNASAIRLKFTAAQVSSKRQRRQSNRALCQKEGDCIAVYELQGEFSFSTAEAVVRDIIDSIDLHEYFVLDLKRVLQLDAVACKLFTLVMNKVAQRGKVLVFSHVPNNSMLLRVLRKNLGNDDVDELLTFADTDLALEWCENKLIESRLGVKTSGAKTPLRDSFIFAGLDDDEFQQVQALMTLWKYKAGETIVHTGDDADEVFVITKGVVSVLISLPTGGYKRLASFAPGMVFGEMGMIDRNKRSADVVADEDVECYVLHLKEYEELSTIQPSIKIKLLENLIQNFSTNLRRANSEIAVLE